MIDGILPMRIPSIGDWMKLLSGMVPLNPIGVEIIGVLGGQALL